jgi:hypothetical protein
VHPGIAGRHHANDRVIGCHLGFVLGYLGLKALSFANGCRSCENGLRSNLASSVGSVGLPKLRDLSCDQCDPP